MKTPPPPSLSRRDFLRLVSAGTAALAGGSTLRSYAESAAMTKGRPLGVALLGLGKYSTGELGPSLRETKLCRLTGVVSGVPEKAAQWARDYHFPAKNIYNYENLERIADNPEIDLVYVVTPPGTHRDFVIRCAKAGKHVISEKPLATNVEDCDAMIAACREAKVMFSVGYRLHFDPYHLEMVRLARDKDFGVLTKMTGDRGFIFGRRAWRIDKKLAGGGPMMDLGIYIVHGSIMAQDGASPVSVTAQELPKKKPELFNEVEESMAWTMDFANGAHLEAVSSYNHSADKFRAEGDKGWIDFRERAFTYYQPYPGGAQVFTPRGRLHFDLPVHQQALQIDDFADCVLTGRQTSVGGELGRRDIRILSAIYEAAATVKRVAV